MNISMWNILERLQYPNIVTMIKEGQETIEKVRWIVYSFLNEHTVYVGEASEFFYRAETGTVIVHRNDFLLVPDSDPEEVFNEVCSVLDNFQDWERNLRALMSSEDAYPDDGYVQGLHRQDCRAHHQCLDGGPLIDYTKVPKLQRGWFDFPLEWEALSCGATVRPGNPTLDDMNDWKEAIHWPSLDEIDFDEMKTMNEKYLGTDRINQLGIHLGFWERLMCLMDVSNAAIALVDEDQEYLALALPALVLVILSVREITRHKNNRLVLEKLAVIF